MSNLTLGGFLKLSKQQQIEHFNQNIAKANPSNLLAWEVALRTALEQNTAEPLKLYSGLIPFCKSVNIVREMPNVDEPTARQLLVASNVDAKIANLFAEDLKASELFAMSDEDILAIKGVGKKTLKIVRELQPK